MTQRRHSLKFCCVRRVHERVNGAEKIDSDKQTSWEKITTDHRSKMPTEAQNTQQERQGEDGASQSGECLNHESAYAAVASPTPSYKNQAKQQEISLAVKIGSKYSKGS